MLLNLLPLLIATLPLAVNLHAQDEETEASEQATVEPAPQAAPAASGGLRFTRGVVRQKVRAGTARQLPVQSAGAGNASPDESSGGQDESAADTSQDIRGNQGTSASGAGISNGGSFGQFTPIRSKLLPRDGSSGTGNGSDPRSSASSANCPVEDASWKPGNVNAQIDPTAWHVMAPGQTVAYRIYEGQLVGEYGTRIELFESPHGRMVLSSRACVDASYTPAARKDGCHATGEGGASIVTFYSPAKAEALTAAYRQQNLTVGKDVPAPCAPAPAGQRNGLNFWYLNVGAEGPCPAGVRKADGGISSDVECLVTVFYYGGSPGALGQASSAAPAPSAPPVNTCWKAPSGRRCCDVMFSPTPSECLKRP